MKALTLQTPTPDALVQVLRAAADEYRETQGELQVAWQDVDAGNFWGTAATELDRAADKLEKYWERL